MYNYTLFIDIEKHLLEDKQPSVYFYKLLMDNLLNEYPFTMISDLKDVEQNMKYHPEGNVWNHTMLVVDEAAKRKDSSEYSKAFMWAALLHDIGKKPTTKLRNGRLTSYNHDTVGKNMAVKFISCFSDDNNFINRVSALVRWHMQPLFIANNLPFSDIERMLNEVPLNEISLLSLCDRMGRGDMSEEKSDDEKAGINMFIEKCENVIKKKYVGRPLTNHIKR